MQFNPKVSIIIPVYNGSNYLREAIDSALAQSYKNLEILVINDGSLDDGKTESIALSYGEKIRYFSKENGGVSSALNYGIAEMRGEWFSWLSHDDLYSQEKIESQIAFCKTNNDIKIVASNLEIIDENGTAVEIYKNNLHQIVNTGREALEVWIYGCSLLIHQSCFDHVGLFTVDNKTVQDDEMWLRLLTRYKIYFMQEILCKCRRHSCSSSENLKDEHKIDKFNYFRMILDQFDICWFFPKTAATTSSSQKSLQEQTYRWIGDYAMNTGSIDGAILCYERAAGVNPYAPLSIMTRLLGARNLIRVRTWLRTNSVFSILSMTLRKLVLYRVRTLSK